MTVEVILETPLAQALNAAIQPKLIEVGWSAGDDATALSEYIILMLVNGKNQEQIASELAGDLLQLGPEDPGAREFSEWLFQQIDILDAQLNRGQGQPIQSDRMDQGYQNSYPESQDAIMGSPHDISDRVPTGPKSMRNHVRGAWRDKRIMNQMSKAMDRSYDPALHRIRPHTGNERVGRITPTGPRQQMGMSNRGGLRPQNNRINSMGVTQGSSHASHNGPASNVISMGPQQQLELYAMLEQQSRMMARLIEAQGRPTRGAPVSMGNGHSYSHQAHNGRSLFDRTQQHPRGLNGDHRGIGAKFGDHQFSKTPEDSSLMDIDSVKDTKEYDPESTTCKFNLACTNKDCKFAHQSPAAPPDTVIDYKDTCSFGAACKNRKCTGKHPSPAQKIAHQTEMDCKFFPNCTNPRCPFRHPSKPLCRNGAECIASDCKFTHVKTMCKFNPCLNPSCTFKHVEGQKRGKFEDKVWTANSTREHVSERKFVDENGPEELIVPGMTKGGINHVSIEI